MDQSEDREEGVPPSTTTVSGEHENQTRDQRMDDEEMILDEWLMQAVEEVSSYIDLTQSDGREEQSKDETTETHNKRMENKLSNMTDYNGLYWNQYPYYMPYITYYPPVGPVSDGIRPERPLETGSVPEPKVNPAEHHQRMILPSSYMNRTQSDCREEQSKDETTETHNKRVENEVGMLTDLIKQCKDSLKTCVKLTEDELRNMTDWIQESEDTLMEFVKLIWKYGESENDTDNKDSQLSALKRMKTRLEMLLTKIKVSSYMNRTQSDCREEQSKDETTETHNKRMDNKLSNMVDLMQERENAQMAHMKPMENKLSSMADCMKQREDVMMAHMKFMMDKFCNMVDFMNQREDAMMAQNKLTENKLSNMADCMKQREDVLMAHMKLTENKLSSMADLMKQREDVLMAHMKLMDNKYSSMADLMKQREDVMMAHMKLMDNKLSNMVDLMKEREDAMMAHIKPKRLQDKGSDSTDPEHEPREEPSSHSDSGKSSCMSFSSDRSMNRPIDFKGSRPSALKKKRNRKDEGSDSTESELEPWDEPSSHSDSDGKSSCVSFKSDDSMNRPIDFKGSRPSATKRKRLEEKGSD